MVIVLSFQSLYLGLIRTGLQLVEARHANAHYVRAIAVFSYIWFKYDILSLHCCKLRSVVVIMLSYQPAAPGFNSRLVSECVMQYAGTGKEMHEAVGIWVW